MKFGTNIRFAWVTVASILVLYLAVVHFWSSKARVASTVKITLQDVSGKPLKSLFDEVQVDKRYPEFRRLVARQRASTCGERQGQMSRLLHRLHLWIDPVVYACPSSGSCSCAYRTAPPVYDPCASDCGTPELLDENIMDSNNPPDGVKAGALVCINGGKPTTQCPGFSPTVDCHCPGVTSD